MEPGGVAGGGGCDQEGGGFGVEEEEEVKGPFLSSLPPSLLGRCEGGKEGESQAELQGGKVGRGRLMHTYT